MKLLYLTGYLCKMQIEKNVSLKRYNTFGIDLHAAYFSEVKSLPEFWDLVGFSRKEKIPLLILGGGSNVLFTKDFNGLVILNRLAGKEVVRETETDILLEVNGGEIWSELVDYCVDRNWGGVENLSLIPGTVGAAPIQNIGAYGVEIKELIEDVKLADLQTGTVKVLTNKECKFGYRDSIFKTYKKGSYFILTVTLRLSKQPKINLLYAPLKAAFQNRNSDAITIKEVSEAVKHIRRSKLPDPLEIGNSGSFFKNPVVDEEKLHSLRLKYPDIPYYSFSKNRFKLAAGWLIDQCGWKGKRIGDAGVHQKQALVLINFGAAKGRDILYLATQIKEDVKKQFGVELEYEVNIIE